jgi:hypothetical protein
VPPNLEPDPLVQRLRSDPAEFQDLVALDGYLGESAEEGKHRLYHDSSLSFWVEIDEEDIVHRETVRVLGAPDTSLVWVKRGATLTADTSPPDPLFPEFLRTPFTPEDLLDQGDPAPWP